MELSEITAKQILDTLPIGYYIGRDIPVNFNKEKKCSSYNPTEDSIEISFQQLRQGTSKELIRSNFYHEISHAILTPPQMLTQTIAM